MRYALASLALVAASCVPAPEPAEPHRPNILWIVAEDLGPYIAAFGDSTVATPNLDRLAAEGIRYPNLFSPSGVCAPSRAAIALGMYPNRIAAGHMRTGGRNRPGGIPEYEAIPPAGTRMHSEHLRMAGYYTSNNSKTDYQFRPPVTAWDESSGSAHWRNRAAGQPFFSIFNIFVTHESQIWARADRPVLVPDSVDVPVPPYLPATPVAVKDIRRMYSNIIEMDRRVGEIMAELEGDGLLDSTIVFWYTDHGGPLPRQKRMVFDSGLRAPMIIRYPDGRGAGSVDARMLSFVDLKPTVLSLAGVEPPAGLDGVPFAGAFVGASPPELDGVPSAGTFEGESAAEKFAGAFEGHPAAQKFAGAFEGHPAAQKLNRASFSTSSAVSGAEKLNMASFSTSTGFLGAQRLNRGSIFNSVPLASAEAGFGAMLNPRSERRYIHAAGDRFDTVYDGVRATRDARFKYIRHLDTTRAYYVPVPYRENQPIMQELLRLRDAGRLSPEQALWFRESRPEEELFDTVADPHELVNLAGETAMAGKLAELREETSRWMEEIADLGVMPEAELVSRLWPDGTQPVTETVRFEDLGGVVALRSGTAGASIGYRFVPGGGSASGAPRAGGPAETEAEAAGRWRVYQEPIARPDGTRLEAVAHRIGFVPSEVAVFVR